ncbi:hypothetical protein CHLRE_04g229226v5 [Chlamydomonas reinhardtii]|uniref:Uncharacterized protein n=1 Tax=Chlamydomonas reinhardtii TaxID=3055 RepID=A0A2K3DUU1_CHLRE|nr:uncharacterized protein CHLRE_04g229226v5 [Chlamydomonas reinhardtii]XP_042925426.1 uncharacterized protein CHLRE_04g229226v5 [Chlamydomonas reinhardtii]PNW84309.1 hypothetical protein CHLRE_04g229226v5 [Chlamydomonas reinhardtii]PNW84310.1 hypothetical protein CHLRE_04g229226v5 [Chlamydomonas reinhardtii]
MDANVKFWDRGRPSAWIHYLRGHTRPVSAVRFSYGTTGLCANGSGPGSKVRYGSIGPWARQQQLPWRRLGMVAGGSCAALLLLGLSRRHAAACGCGACCWLPGHAGGVYTAEGGRHWVNTVAVGQPPPPAPPQLPLTVPRNHQPHKSATTPRGTASAKRQ